MKKILELITNPKTGKLSSSDCAVSLAFVVSSIVVLYQCFNYQQNELLLGTYLAAWVAQSQASKRAAIKRDVELKDDSND
ncbi:hypothetical protein [Gilliamella sp. Fer4-1]|uniref:hypothetical protein n=1 Tax=Gilliamella sp. Fer4-1 TaxID=3120242 RepID=UPI00080EAAD8|nr:hypothetical protein [Gilliamella apicola]OCG62227.1 hypothetical protein A9G30_09315 [Gilliamella apicola]